MNNQGLDFRGRNKNQDYEAAKRKAIRDMSWYNKNVHKNYLEEQASLSKDLRDMSKSIDKELNDKAKWEEYLIRNPHRKEDCLENAKNCVTGACEYITGVCTSVFPKKYTTTTTPYSKKITEARNPENHTIPRNHANQRNLILLIKSPKGLDVSNIHPQITYSIKNM